jgi:hypothetical protein
VGLEKAIIPWKGVAVLRRDRSKLRTLAGIWRSVAKRATVPHGRDEGRGRVPFDQRRLDALVHYIAHQVRALPDFGRVKLAKVLFYSDFTAYRETGASLTGATYLRYPKGPFPRELWEAEARLERGGRVRLAYDVNEYEEKRILPLTPPTEAEALYEPWQLDFVRRMIPEVGSRTSRGISDRSHEHAGWITVEDGAEIPYGTAFVPDEPPTCRDAETARRIARERGWLTAEGWVWERERGAT